MSELNEMIFIVLVVSIVPLLGLLLAATPWLMRSRECFTVTVPSQAQRDPQVVALKRSYTLAMVVATLVVLAADVALFAASQIEAGFAVMVVGSLGLPALSFALMLKNRARVTALKEERGWRAEGNARSAVVAEGDIPRVISLGWEALSVPVIAATLAIGLIGYSSMPDVVPMHVGLDGQVNGWAEKSVALILFAPGIQTFMLLCFVFSHWSIVRSKKPNVPDAPVSSAYAYGLFARAQSIYLVVLGVLLNTSLVTMQLSTVGVMSLVSAGMLVGAVALVAVVGAVALAVVYGQSGSRIIERMGSASAMPYDEDRYWKLGVLYVNREDPSLFVPARFGVGWTSNFGRPLTWVLMAAIIVLTVGLVVFAVLVV